MVNNEKWYRPKTPDQIGEDPVPWLHPAVVLYLESLLRPDWMILEHGCGGSTLWFAERVRAVHAVDNDPEWTQVVEYQSPGNVTMFFDHKPVYFKGRNYDLLLIDGWKDDRPEWIRLAPKIVRPGGIVIVDNYNRPECAEEIRKLDEISTTHLSIDLIGNNLRYIKTRFYRLPGGSEKQI